MTTRSVLRDSDDHDVLAVSEFKARCLEVLETLRHGGRDLILTKHGEPIARVVPIRKPRPLRGLFKGQIEIKGDIVHADFGNDWEANK
jgi:prevent-host-death family protein